MAGPSIPTSTPVYAPGVDPTPEGVDPVEQRARALASIIIQNSTDDDAKERIAALRKRLSAGRTLEALAAHSPTVARFGSGIADDATAAIKSEEGTWGPEARALKLTLGQLGYYGKVVPAQVRGDTARDVAGINGDARVEAAKVGGGGPMGRPTLTQLPGGQIAWASPPSAANPSGVVTPAPLPNGAPAIKGKTLSTVDVQKISDVTEKETQLTNLLTEFEQGEKNLAGRGVGGEMGVRAAQFLGSDADSIMGKGAQDRADFWSRFHMFYDLPVRHTLFGSQLTSGEREEWKRAQNIGPKTDPAIIKRNMKILIGLANKASRKMVGSRVRDGYNPEALREATGWDALPADLVAPPGQVPPPAVPPQGHALPLSVGTAPVPGPGPAAGVPRYTRDSSGNLVRAR